MEIEINVIHNKIFSKLYLKIRVKGKKFHNISFSSKKWATWENRYIDCRKYEYLPDKKVYSNSNENMLFLRKTDETIWQPPPPPFN